MKTKKFINNSRPILLKVQNLFITTSGVEIIHAICINCPKTLEIQVNCLKTKQSGFSEENNLKA